MGYWKVALALALLAQTSLASTVSIPGNGTTLNNQSDIVVDTITYNSAISACTGTGCGVQLQKITGVPDSADLNTLRLYDDDGFAVIVDPTNDPFTIAKGTLSDAFTVGYPATFVVGDSACATQGTADASPECGREVCSNVGMTCVEVLNFIVITVPAAASCTDLIGAGRGIVSCK